MCRVDAQATRARRRSPLLVEEALEGLRREPVREFVRVSIPSVDDEIIARRSGR